MLLAAVATCAGCESGARRPRNGTAVSSGASGSEVSCGQPATAALIAPAPVLDARSVVVGFVVDVSMMHSQVGVVVWRGARREPVFDAGRYVGPCSTDTYLTLVPAARRRDVVIALGCDGRGVAEHALAIIEVARLGDQLVVRAADLLDDARTVGSERVIRRVPLEGSTSVRAALPSETAALRVEEILVPSAAPAR